MLVDVQIQYRHVSEPNCRHWLGQAGINVLSTLHSIIPDDEEREWYCFIAIDSDGESLQKAPPDTTRLALSIDGDFVQQDCQEYPYLVRTLSIPPRRTARQRPVGRYALDNRGEFLGRCSDKDEECGGSFIE